MELGALVCTARSPGCEACPLAPMCAWHRAGCPPDAGPRPRAQRWSGTDRQVRGRLVQVLRDASGPVDEAELDAAWDDEPQRRGCLASLVDDGLVEPLPGRRYRLPGTP